MDDNDFNYKDATFPTGIDSIVETDSEVLRLPDVVNFVALRETCLSEAPFVNRSNRKFWKKWMDSSQYITILCATLKILLDCINENGNVDARLLYDIKNNPLMEQMSMCIAEMLVKDRNKNSRAHDNLFMRLPELLCYMLVNSLHSCNPRQSRVFNAVKFREMLLDWMGELIGGIRITNCQSDRKWLFADTIDTPVVINNSSFLQTLTPKPHGRLQLLNKTAHSTLSSSGHTHSKITLPAIDDLKNTATTTALNTSLNAGVVSGPTTGLLPPGSRTSGGNISSKGGSTCHFTIGNSPLVSIYMNLGRNTDVRPHVCAHPMKLILTTQPDRPLTSMTPDCLLKAGAFREKKMPPEKFQQALKTSAGNRKFILKQLELEKLAIRLEMKKADQTLRIQYSLLENKTVDTKKHILASSSTLDAMKYNPTATSSVASNELP